MDRISTSPHGRDLRKGRWSLSGQVYLLTVVTVYRAPRFAEWTVARQAVRAFHSPQVAAHVTTLAFVVMPDHVHWQAQLNHGGTVSEAVRLYKVTVSVALGGGAWQRAFMIGPCAGRMTCVRSPAISWPIRCARGWCGISGNIFIGMPCGCR
ncbi:transposase [Immundisolibacter sp.]|uniref:transposase n=1 Tax=Immundisolibacter sp. TaxID=1934948 RepID=UPI0025BBA55F|nr:transposase [Immundisolibacter sp.]